MGSHCKTTIQNQCNPSPLSAHTFLVGPLKVLWCSHPVLQGHHQPGNGHSLLLRECCLFLPPLHHSHLPHTPSLPLPLHKHLLLFKHLCFHIEVISRHLNNKCTYVATKMVIRVWSENPSLCLLNSNVIPTHCWWHSHLHLTSSSLHLISSRFQLLTDKILPPHLISISLQLPTDKILPPSPHIYQPPAPH